MKDLLVTGFIPFYCMVNLLLIKKVWNGKMILIIIIYIYMKLKKRNNLNFKTRRFLKSNAEFSQQQAKRADKIDYYRAQIAYMKMYNEIEKEKLKLSTPKWEYVTDLINYYKNLGESEWKSPAGKALLGIYKKNKEAVLKNKKVKNTNLIDIVSKPEILLLAYKSIRSNKGAMTQGTEISVQEYKKLSEEQKELYISSLTFPDKFNMKDVLLTSRLLKKGLYPWGCSTRVYVPKPGVKDKMRPITIPPFLDRVVQKAIFFVLLSIYEPEFEKLNRSFAYRPNKGVHDAMIACSSNYSSGKVTAIEGDIEAAYDSVVKKIMLDILKQKITDRKFLNLIKDRLNYTYAERKINGKIVRTQPDKGIPQGGIDSPYLFNIYMHELDKYIHNDIQKDYIDKLNDKLVKGKRYLNKIRYENEKLQDRIVTNQKKIKKQLKKIDQNNKSAIQEKRLQLFQEIKRKRALKHINLGFKSSDPQKKKISIFYIRYADDWILLTNGDKQIANKIKNKISSFLQTNLGLKLSEKKTIITNITKKPAKFLGFEVKHPLRGPIVRSPLRKESKFRKTNLQRQTGSTIVWLTADRKRLIQRMHLKGFCTRNGFPKEKPWLSCFEDQVIIERYNSCMRGMAEYFMPIIRSKSDLQRWIYILRYSCLKTFAQKYRTSIKGIFKKFGIKRNLKSEQTIKTTIRLKIKQKENENGKIMEKSWILYTYKDLKKIMSSKEKRDAIKQRRTIFWEIEKNNRIGEYPIKVGNIPTVTNENYLNKISWVSLRTQASLDMPCANCGAMESQQHHVKHIRKNTYALLEEGTPLKKIMGLRNRKQVPLCEKCHRIYVHGGEYDQTKLMKLVPTKLVDNRVVHVESFVKPGIIYNAKSLEEKGWKTIQNNQDL